MSEDDKKPGEGPRILHVVHDNEGKPHIAASISEEQVKQLFMQSKHIAWAPFAKSMGWPVDDRRRYPEFQDWAREKREMIARNQSEEIAESLFSHRPRWHSDVLNTLKEYPEVCDHMMMLLKKRLNDAVTLIKEDNKERVQHVQSKSKKAFKPSFDKEFDNSELLKLASAIKVITESKHKALMIDKWNLSEAEKFTDPEQFEAPNHEDQTWKVLLNDGREVGLDEMRDIVKPWYDVPSQYAEPKAASSLETT